MTYAQRIPACMDGSVDIVADVMTINCTRWAQISFSSQYFDAGQKVLVRDRLDRPRSIDDLERQADVRREGLDELRRAKKNYPKVIAVGVDDISDCMVLFQQGTVDSVTGDDTVLAGFVAQDPYAQDRRPRRSRASRTASASPRRIPSSCSS